MSLGSELYSREKTCLIQENKNGKQVEGGCCTFFFFFFNGCASFDESRVHLHIYIYIRTCVCVCVCCTYTTTRVSLSITTTHLEWQVVVASEGPSNLFFNLHKSFWICPGLIFKIHDFWAKKIFYGLLRRFEFRLFTFTPVWRRR